MLPDIELLRDWFLNQKRDLPWRNTKDPYAIWVSEIMLQQTQVSVVIPYFKRWMDLFPTIQQLASSPIEKVLKAWEGLGYYSRARNLHEGACYLVENHGGFLPNDEASLKKIKGIGPYTVGAILSFAFHQKKAAVDGNVIRVLTRLFNIHEDIKKTKTIHVIRSLAESILPDIEPWVISEALIELGATVCSKKPKCLECPFIRSCQSYLKGESDLLPINSVKFKTELLIRRVFIIQSNEMFLIRKPKSQGIMQDLCEFPYVEIKKDEVHHFHKVLPPFLINLHKISDFEEVTHSFTRFKVRLIPSLFTTDEIREIEDHQWIPLSDLKNLAFSSGHKKLFQRVLLEQTSNV